MGAFIICWCWNESDDSDACSRNISGRFKSDDYEYDRDHQFWINQLQRRLCEGNVSVVGSDESPDSGDGGLRRMSDEITNNEPIIGPNQVIESSRKLDTVLAKGIREGRRGSLSGKIANLLDDMEDFTRETHTVIDGVAEKIAEARQKREEAAEAQHAHFGGLIKDFQDTIDAIDRLANYPFEEDGKK